MKNKGGTHVGIVISFAIFVTFLFFLYSITEPAINIQKDKQTLLDYLERELIENFSAEMITITIMVDETITGDCIRLQNIKEDIENVTTNIEKLIIKDESNNIRSYSFQGQALRIENPDYTQFFKIYNSEELERSPIFSGGGCQPIGNTEYNLGLIRTEEYIFETKIIEIKDKYKDDYETLRDELKIPAGSEFGFSFTYSNGTIIKTEAKESSTSVYAEEIPIQYIDEEANILPGFITTKVW